MQLAFFKATSSDVKTELHTNEIYDYLQPAVSRRITDKEFCPAK